MTAQPADMDAMRRALELASRGGSHPNPTVGAVVLDQAGQVVSEGVTDLWPGLGHAESRALSGLGSGVADTVVVTLEPCNHVGRSDPCTELLIESGVRRVVVGALDPDPRVAGTGVQRLREANIEVETGIMDDEVVALDPAYFHHRRTGRPFFTLKTAMTIDGQTAAADGSSQWITGDEARRDAHRLRAATDAVMIGAGTLLTDDPTLTIRLPSYTGPQPVAVVVAGRRPLPAAAAVWSRDDTIVVCTEPKGVGVTELIVDAGAGGWPDPGLMASALGERGLVSVLVEGGATLAASLRAGGLIDAGVTYLAARLAGGSGRGMFTGNWDTFDSSTPVTLTGARRLGSDLRVDWHPMRESDTP